MDEDERRQAPRRRVLKGGRIVVNEQSTFQCTIRNVTEIGALVKVASVVGIPDTFALWMDDGRRFSCTAIWKTATEIGVKFG